MDLVCATADGVLRLQLDRPAKKNALSLAMYGALATALSLAAKPPTAMRLTKLLLKRTSREAAKAQIREEGERFTERLRSPENAEAIAAFFEHRRPDFTHAT